MEVNLPHHCCDDVSDAISTRRCDDGRSGILRYRTGGAKPARRLSKVIANNQKGNSPAESIFEQLS